MNESPHGEPLPDHPSSEQIAAYLSGQTSVSDRAALESHLAECWACRQQLISARRLLAPHRTRRPLMWVVPVAAAAVLAWVAFSPSLRSRGPEALAVRGGQDSGGPDETAALRVVAPADGDTVSRGGVVFVWHAHPGRPLFRLTLADASGRELWSDQTQDTTLALPLSVALDPGRTYSWFVDALGADGRSLTTRTQRFSTAP